MPPAPEPFVPQPSGNSPKADVGGDDAEKILAVAKLQVVHPDHLGAVHVHDLLVEDVALDQNVAILRGVLLPLNLIQEGMQR